MQPPPRHLTDSGPRAEDQCAGDESQFSERHSVPPTKAFWSRSGLLLAAVLVMFVGTRLWASLALQMRMPDTLIYAMFSRQGVDLKLAPYRDFDMEYPPAAWWFIALPRLVDRQAYRDLTPPPETIQRFFDWYFWWFHAELFLADLVCLGLTFSIGRRVTPAVPWVLPAAYTLLTVAQPYLMYDRLDLVLLMLCLLCIDCWLRSLENTPAANRWAVASYFFLGWAVSFKIVPVIFVPYLLLADLWAAGRAWRFLGRVSSLAVSAVGPFLVYIPSAGWGVFKLFRYHSERGTNLESVWSGLMLAAEKFGVPCDVYYSHGGYNLAGQWSTTLKSISGVTLLGMAAGLGLWALLRGRQYDRRLALDAALLALVNSTVFSHVYSPQYLFWLMPLALLLAMNIFGRSRAIWCAFGLLVVAIVAISSWICPAHFIELTKLEPLPVALTIVRSACLVGLALLLSISFVARYGLIPWHAGRPAATGLAVAT